MNGFTDADWDKFLKDLDAYGLEEYLSIFQKYLDAYYEESSGDESSDSGADAEAGTDAETGTGTDAE